MNNWVLISEKIDDGFYDKFAEKKEVIFLMSLCKIISNTGQDFLLGFIGYSENGRFDLFDFFFISKDYVIFVDGFMQNCLISFFLGSFHLFI